MRDGTAASATERTPADLRAAIDGMAAIDGRIDLSAWTASLGGPVGLLPACVAAAPDAVLLDQLGARLHFERASVRLYDGLVGKLDAVGTYAGGPSRNDLIELRDEELEHALVLRLVIASLGGDPTEVTPAADDNLWVTHRVSSVLVDPRTSLVAGLAAMKTAEQVDRDAWERLVRLVDAIAENGGLIAAVCRAQKHEEEHLLRLRAWLAARSS